MKSFSRNYREEYPNQLLFQRGSQALAAYDVGGRRGATNLIKGGNLPNTSDWIPYGGTLVNGELTITGAATSNRIDQNSFSGIAGHVYYLQFIIQSPKSSRIKALINNSYSSLLTVEANVATVFSVLVTAGATVTPIRLYCNDNALLEVGDKVYYSKIMAIDLTAEFGSTVEPVVSYCQAEYATWFEGTRLDKRRVSLTVPSHVARWMPADNSMGMMIEEGTTNIGTLALSAFSKAGNDLNDSGITVGMSKLYELVATTTTPQIYQDGVSTAAPFACSFVVRKGTAGFAVIRLFDTPSLTNGVRQWFDLTAGTVGQVTYAGTGYTRSWATIESYYGNYWLIKFGCVTPETSKRFIISQATADGNLAALVGATMYVGSLQIEQKAYPTSQMLPGTTRQPEVVTVPTYIKTTAGNETNLLTESLSNTFTAPWTSPTLNGTYQVKVGGSVGSITLSGGATGTVNFGETLQIVVSNATVTFTPTGNPTKVLLEAGTRAGSWVPGGYKRLLDATGGEIEVEFVPTATTFANRTDGYTTLLTHTYPSINKNQITLASPTPGGSQLSFTLSDSTAYSGGAYNVVTSATSFSVGTKYTVKGKWVLNGEFSIWVNGIKEDFATADKVPEYLNQFVHLGRNPFNTTSRYANSIFTAVRFYDYAGNLTQEWDLTGPVRRYKPQMGGM